MEELLELEFFTNLFSPARLKVLLFIFNIIKCTVLLVVVVKLLRWFFDKLFKNIAAKTESRERKQQVLTLKTIILHAVELVIFLIYITNILFLFGIDVRPLLATAGVMGVAIGFGAKRFVEDIITGIIILIEGQIRVGDYVEVQGIKGFVEKITLPLVTVRSDTTGALCFVRCGYIDSIINHTMHYSYAFFELDVAYKENINHVFETLKRCFEILKSDEINSKKIIGDFEILGLDSFKDSSICIKCRIKTQPKEQWFIKRKFNKIVKENFDKENIEIPFNQLVITDADKG